MASFGVLLTGEAVVHTRTGGGDALGPLNVAAALLRVRRLLHGGAYASVHSPLVGGGDIQLHVCAWPVARLQGPFPPPPPLCPVRQC